MDKSLGGSQNGAWPLRGTTISLITFSDIRYEGILQDINSDKSTVDLCRVKCFGTEDRQSQVIEPEVEIYGLITFRGSDIKDLKVIEHGGRQQQPQSPANSFQDPAILSVQTRPATMQPHPEQSPMAAPGYAPPSRHTQNSSFPQSGQSTQHPPASTPDAFPKPDRYNTYSGDPWSDRGGANRYGNQGDSYPSYGEIGDRRNNHSKSSADQTVGQLEPAINERVKSELEKEFDLEESNRQFQKKDTTNEDELNGSSPGGYKKSASFFDSISCETLDRQIGHDNRVTRVKQRQLDMQTFGSAYVESHSRGMSQQRGRRGGRGGRGGFGRGGMLPIRQERGNAREPQYRGGYDLNYSNNNSYGRPMRGPPGYSDNSGNNMYIGGSRGGSGGGSHNGYSYNDQYPDSTVYGSYRNQHMPRGGGGYGYGGGHRQVRNGYQDSYRGTGYRDRNW